MTCDSPVSKRRNAKLLPMQLFLYGVFMPLVLFAHPARNSPLAYLLALTLSLTMVGTIIALAVMAARQTDEFQRKLLMQAMLWGIGGTLSITTVWGLLEFFTNVWQMPVLSIFPIFLAITMTAKISLFRSYRPADE